MKMPRVTGLLVAALTLSCVYGVACHAAPLVVDANGCLHVDKTGPSDSCTSQSSSLQVDLINTCRFPVRAQLCLRGADHLWVACESRLSMAPKDRLFETSCNSDGAYTFWACSHFSANSGNCGGDNLLGKASNVVAPKK